MNKLFSFAVVMLFVVSIASAGSDLPILTYWNTTPMHPLLTDVVSMNVTCTDTNASAYIDCYGDIYKNGINIGMGTGIYYAYLGTNADIWGDGTTFADLGFTYGDKFSGLYWCDDTVGHNTSFEWSNVTIETPTILPSSLNILSVLQVYNSDNLTAYFTITNQSGYNMNGSVCDYYVYNHTVLLSSGSAMDTAYGYYIDLRTDNMTDGDYALVINCTPSAYGLSQIQIQPNINSNLTLLFNVFAMFIVAIVLFVLSVVMSEYPIITHALRVGVWILILLSFMVGMGYGVIQEDLASAMSLSLIHI